MTHYPSNPAYFIGVGGSPDTGDRQGDLERARAKALSQLASEIEVTIRSDQTFRQTETSTGGGSSTVDIIVRTLTEQNLEGIELVDNFHSEREGYWFYFRLSKVSWDRIKNREMYALRDRILAMIDAVGTPNASIADRLRVYSQALGLLHDSPYGGKIVVDIYGRRGVLDDLISTELGQMLDHLTIAADPSSIRFPPGRSPELRVSVVSTERRQVGGLALEIRDLRGTTLAGLTTDSEGRFIGTLAVAGSKTGRRHCSVGLAPSSLAGADESLLSRAPHSSLEIEVLPLGVRMVLESPDRLDARWLADSVTSVLTHNYALAVLHSGEPTPYRISVKVRGRNSPPNEYGIEFAYCSLSIIFSRDGSEIAALSTAETKGAGTTPEQAVRKAAAGMLEALPRDPALGSAIEAFFAGAWTENGTR